MAGVCLLKLHATPQAPFTGMAEAPVWKDLEPWGLCQYETAPQGIIPRQATQELHLTIPSDFISSILRTAVLQLRYWMAELGRKGDLCSFDKICSGVWQNRSWQVEVDVGLSCVSSGGLSSCCCWATRMHSSHAVKKASARHGLPWPGVTQPAVREDRPAVKAAINHVSDRSGSRWIIEINGTGRWSKP